MNTTTLDHPTTRIHDLIREHAGQEMPSVGTWTVGRGQRVSLVRRGLRRRRVEAIVLDGHFDVARDPACSTFELTLMIADSVELVTVSTAAATGPIELTYRGVFHHRGRVPSLWLSVCAVVAGGTTVRGDLNLNPVSRTVAV